MSEDSGTRPVFLTARWANVVLLNYEIDPRAMAPYLPRATELDADDGRHFVSLVAFQFLRTRVCGIPIPFHVNFPEVNLRFYVRRKGPDGWRRGVVFIKELVPRTAIAAVARWVYNENYVALTMSMEANAQDQSTHAKYRWHSGGMWHGVQASVSGNPALPDADSHAAFIVEHYFGYTAQRDGGTLEYAVEHPSWRLWNEVDWNIEGNPEAVYESPFAEAMSSKPYSVIMAEGSEVLVRRGERIA